MELPEHLSAEQFEIIRACIPSGDIARISTITMGNVHHVFAFYTGNGRRYFAKIRGTRFARMPDVESNPDDILFEKKALEILGEEVPELVPAILCFDRKTAMLVLTDVMPDNPVMERMFNEGTVTPAMIATFGRRVSEVHSKLRARRENIRDDEEAYYHHNLSYRIGFIDHPRMRAATAALATLPRQLTLGELAPKNLSFSRDGDLRMCDFETMHRGARLFDVGFGLGHIVLHSLTLELDAALERIRAFLDMYYKDIDRAQDDDWLMVGIVLGTLWFRTASPLVPYNVPLSASQKSRLFERVRGCLGQDDTLQTVIGVLWDAVHVVDDEMRPSGD